MPKSLMPNEIKMLIEDYYKENPEDLKELVLHPRMLAEELVKAIIRQQAHIKVDKATDPWILIRTPEVDNGDNVYGCISHSTRRLNMWDTEQQVKDVMKHSNYRTDNIHAYYAVQIPRAMAVSAVHPDSHAEWWADLHSRVFTDYRPKMIIR